MNNIGTREKDFYTRRPLEASLPYGWNKDYETEVQYVKNHVRLASIIGRYVKLKKPKNWNHYVGLCPFHEEKTPSFNLMPRNDTYHCHGCGTGGDMFTFIMKMEGLNFIQSLERIKKLSGIKIQKKYGNIYKEDYFKFRTYTRDDGSEFEDIEFAQDEVSQKVRNIIYQRRQEMIESFYGKSFNEN